MSQGKNNKYGYSNSLENFQRIEQTLAAKLGFRDLKAGTLVMSDENGWRENERSVEYIWIVELSRSFIGWGGLFAIKFNANKFREHSNQEEIIQGIFISGKKGIEHMYTDRSGDLAYEITRFFKFNLFKANKGIALDGVSYRVRIIAPNIDTFIALNNPNTEDWKKWEKEIWVMGKKLAKESNNEEMVRLFE